jgi:hypothetical protein
MFLPYFCLQNISPVHTPDIVVYIDAITIVFEEALKDGPPSSLPIACIEAGNEHSLPNLALRLLFTLGILIYYVLLALVLYSPDISLLLLMVDIHCLNAR